MKYISTLIIFFEIIFLEKIEIPFKTKFDPIFSKYIIELYQDHYSDPSQEPIVFESEFEINIINVEVYHLH